MPEPLRILHSCFSASWGGLEMQALEVPLRLRRRGHAVWLACTAGTRLETEARREELNVLPLGVTGYVHPAAIRRLRRFLNDNTVGLLHSHLSRDLATLVPALTGRRTPLLLSKRVGSAITKRDLLHRYTYARVDLVLAVSSVIRRNVIDTTPVPPGRVLTLHDAIDTSVFSPRAGAGHLRSELGIPPECVVVGFVGRFSPGKGLEALLEAARLLSGNHPDLRLIIVGEASHGEEGYGGTITALRDRLGLAEIVRFAGFRRDVPDALASFDIFAFPSHAESFGVALIEAMAMHLPVVASNCDGVLDIVVDGKTGVLVPPGDAASLAGALQRLLEDPLLRQEMGAAGRKRVMGCFDRERQMDRLEEIYRSLLARGTSGSEGGRRGDVEGEGDSATAPREA